MEISAKTIVVLPIESGTSKSGKPWQKQSFVVETGEKYLKKICFQLFGDKVNDCPKIGDEVKVSFDIDSQEYKGRWYTQLNAWKVEKAGICKETAYPAPQQQMLPQQPTQQVPPLPFSQDDTEQLPF